MKYFVSNKNYTTYSKNKYNFIFNYAYLFGVFHNRCIRSCISLYMFNLDQGCQTHFMGGHISLTVAFKGPNVILGLYKCNYSLSRGKELGAAAG